MENTSQKSPVLEKLKSMGKWFWAFVGVAIALVAAIVVAIVIGVTANKEPDKIPEGPETGTYYYDNNGTEYTLNLHSGNQFALYDGANRVGEYTVDGNTISFDFTKDSNGSATGTYSNDVITMTYNNAEIRFLRKVSYTVSYVTNGGSAVVAAKVINGMSAVQPGDPVKEGNVFLGWYTDAALTTPYTFGTAVVTADVTLYAKWAEKSAAQAEVNVSFYGAELDPITTIGGKLYNLPVPTKDGYTFGGWWISAYENADKLTYKVEEGDALTADSTLFALWLADTGSKLPAPLVEVDSNGIKWNAVNGASHYAVKITAPGGAVVFEDNVSETAKTFDFALAGEYVVEVSAVSSISANNNSDVTARYYAAKALDRVYKFTVVEPSVLVFNSVAGAEKYYISIVCGNADHNHTAIDNGNSTVYNFSGCEMKAGGIEFVVTAAAEGYASSVSTTYKYERKLDKVSEIALDSDTLVWLPVAGAAGYKLEITCDEHGSHTVMLNTYSYSLKNCSGEIEVNITPITEGYVSPEAALYTYTKEGLAAPENIVVNGNVISWNAVENATSYTVKIGAQSFTVTAASIDLATVNFTAAAGDTLEISVTAVGADSVSAESDKVSVKYLAFNGALSYDKNYVSWTPVTGANGKYEVKVNNGTVVTVENANSAPIVFTQAGVNTISVRFVSTAYTSDWLTTNVNVYEITLDTRLGSGVGKLYAAYGDEIVLPKTSVRTGYNFVAWYNTPKGAGSNGKLIADGIFTERDDTVYYAYWTPKSYNVTYNVDTGVTGVENGDTVVVKYNSGFQLGVPASDKGAFIGWFTGRDGSGVQITNASGESLSNYTFINDITVYPSFEIGVLTYVDRGDGTWAVTKGPSIELVENLIIPETYQGKKVTAILENAFQGCANLKTVSIPNTVDLIGTGALTICINLEAINVREIEGNHEVIYSSYDGALIRNDFGTNYLEYYPRAKSGTYTVPDTVDSIRNKAFMYAKFLEKVTISDNVTYIADQAFFHCNVLTEIEFEAGGNKALAIEDGAFVGVEAVTKLTLPARLSSMSLETLDAMTALNTINVEEGGSTYGSVSGYLTDGDDTLIYAPVAKTGAFTVPVGITAIGDGALSGRVGITSVSISSWTTHVGENAFASCANLASVTVACGGVNDLTIDKSAFANCKKLKTVTFGTASAAALDVDNGDVIIGESAFANCIELDALNFESNCNVTAIGASAFAGCKKLTAITIPATTASVGDSAFASCESINSVAFAENGVEITFGASVFSGCSKLREIYLPSTIAAFPSSAFTGCDSITKIIVDEDNPVLCSDEAGVLYNKAQTEILFFPKSEEINFANLPTTLTTIGDGAFQNNDTIKTVTIPANITTVGAYAFEGCGNLETVVFSGTADVAMGEYAFANCVGLKNVTLPAATTAISAHMFDGAGIEAPVIPAAVKNIGDFAFSSTMITAVEIPAAVESIGTGAFFSCTALTDVTVAAGAKFTLGTLDDKANNGVFQKCTSLLSVDLGDRVTLIGAYAFNGVSKLATVDIADATSLAIIGSYSFTSTSALRSLTLPEGLTTIADYAFYMCKLDTVEIPGSVTKIGNYGFANSYNFTTAGAVTFANGTADLEIGDYAFYYCQSMVDFEIPARVTKMFNDVQVGVSKQIPMTSFYTIFDGCTKLEAITVETGSTLFASYDGIVYLTDDDGKAVTLLYCPRGNTGDADGKVTVPNTVTFVANASFYQTKVKIVIFEDAENFDGMEESAYLEIGADVTMANFSTDAPFSVFGKSTTLTKVELPVQLKALNAFSFFNNTYTNGVEVVFDQNSAPITIAANAMNGNGGAGLSTLVLPKVKSIGNAAFSNNKKLTSVTFHPDSTFTELPLNAFSSCPALESVTNIPDSVVTLGNSAFSGCTKLGTITWENIHTLKSIGNQAFSQTIITEFTFPENIEFIGTNVLNGCKSLKKVTISSKMTNLLASDGKSAIFTNLAALETINLNGNVNFYSDNGAIYSADKTVLIYVPTSIPNVESFSILSTTTSIEQYALYGFKGTELVIPEGVLKLGDYALSSIKNVESIVIPASVREIGNYAFSSTFFKSISFAAGSVLETIGNGAFNNADALVEIQIPDTVTTLGISTFSYSGVLESVDLSSSLTVIDESVFANCEKLKTVKMYEGITSIEANAFGNCSNLETITIPASVEELNTDNYDGVFSGSSNLKSVVFAEGSQLNYVAALTFAGCSSLESITLPENLTTIPAGLFDDCAALTTVVILGDVETIPANLLAGKTNLTKVVLPDTVTEIGAGAFDGCVNLSEVSIPASVVKIGEAAFRNCASIESVSFGAALTEIGNFAFDGCTNLSDVVFDGNCKIEALGEDPTVESAIFRGTAITSIAIPETVKVLGGNVFENSAIESVVLPEKLEALGNSVFAGCKALTEVSIPETVKSIGDFAFKDCSNVTEVEIGFGVESIGSAAFMNCVEMTTINIPSTINSIEGNPFINCPSLVNFDFDSSNTDFIYEADNGLLFDADKYTLIMYSPANTAETYTIPTGVEVLAAGAFSGSQLKTISIPGAIEEIAPMLFMGSTKLESIVLTNSIASIGDDAFNGCSALTSIEIPASVTEIGAYALANCSELAEVTFSARTAAISFGAHAFDGCASLSEIELPEGTVGVTDYMFANSGIVEFTLPESVTDVTAEGVFAGASALETVVLHNNAGTTLGNKFFYECTALESVDLGSLTILGIFEFEYDAWGDVDSYSVPADAMIFYGCTSLDAIDLTKVIAVGDYSFAGCTELDTITFGNKIAYLGNHLFDGCTGLTTIDMRSITTLPSMYDFLGHSNGAYVGEYIFKDCTNLETVYMPVAKTQFIMEGTFAGCTSLTYIEYGGQLGGGIDLGAKPFEGLTSATTICFKYYNGAALPAGYSPSGLSYHYNASTYTNIFDNIDWLWNTEAVFKGKDNHTVVVTGENEATVYDENGVAVRIWRGPAKTDYEDITAE